MFYKEKTLWEHQLTMDTNDGAGDPLTEPSAPCLNYGTNTSRIWRCLLIFLEFR